MTPAMAVAAAVVFSFVLGSLMVQVDGATLRQWRLSRRWDVSRLAREIITAADEPLASVRGLTHMINAWERGARRPSERYWLLYLQIFPECWATETADDAAAAPQDIPALAAAVKALEAQIAGLSRRLDEMSRRKLVPPRESRTRRPGDWVADLDPLGDGDHLGHIRRGRH
ncbi:MAG TPA: hypothetical protein VMA73_23245 [Streptosporangiaceae bacterium]|nr:hypothetical protein [Streptosporangiaceae bacterium]